MTERHKVVQRWQMRYKLNASPVSDTNSSAVLKPHGVWYEVNGDWRRWCRCERMDSWVSGRWLYRVDTSRCNVLKITNRREFLQFQHAYLGVSPAMQRFGLSSSFWQAPDWARLATEGYDGVEIAPYQWEFRLHPDTMWYYGWDCASGVIWNASKLKMRKVCVLPGRRTPEKTPEQRSAELRKLREDMERWKQETYQSGRPES